MFNFTAFLDKSKEYLGIDLEDQAPQLLEGTGIDLDQVDAFRAINLNDVGSLVDMDDKLQGSGVEGNEVPSPFEDTLTE